jgi:chromosome partitioning protein
MIVITIASRKGGGGKTTIARHLAVEAAAQGHGPVCIVDADAMLGLAQWWTRRSSDEPRLLHSLPDTEPVTAANIKRLVGEGGLPLAIAKLPAALKAASQAGYQLCIIDTAPSIDDDVRACISASDLCLMPVRSTQDDLDAVGDTLRVVKAAGKPAAFVLSAAQRGAISTRAAGNALVHRGELAEPTIHRAEAIPATRGSGQVIGETAPTSVAADEFRRLWIYVAWRLGLGAQPESMLDIDAAAPERAAKAQKKRRAGM